jgi:DNA mismatch repair protein MSH6
VIDDEEEEWDDSIKINKGEKEDSSASSDDDLADSSEEDESGEDSDDEHIKKRQRVKKGGKASVKSVAPSRPPLAPTKSYASTPIQRQAGATSASQPLQSSVYDRCSAQKMSESSFQSNQTTPCSGGTPSSVASTPFNPVLPEGVVGRGSHEHNFFDFLLPANRKDKNGLRPDHPKYNPRSCFVPQSFTAKQTPGMAQWWELKQDNMDTVLFFKVAIRCVLSISFALQHIHMSDHTVHGLESNINFGVQ